MTYSIPHALHRSLRLKQLIERETRAGSTIRLMRLKALLLKTQQRLASLIDGGGMVLRPVPVLATRGR